MTPDEAIRVGEFGGSIEVPLSWLEELLRPPAGTAGAARGTDRIEQWGRHVDWITHLQHRDQSVRRREADDADADLFFPAGAGPFSESGGFTTHGEPSPAATFRFAEPVFIDKQQNFRVEIEVSDTDVLNRFKRIYGPFQIWVILDGYMTRDVQ